MDSTVMHINKGNAYGTQGNALTRLIFNIYHYWVSKKKNSSVFKQYGVLFIPVLPALLNLWISDGCFDSDDWYRLKENMYKVEGTISSERSHLGLENG